jgi:hypothetical protein
MALEVRQGKEEGVRLLNDTGILKEHRAAEKRLFGLHFYMPCQAWQAAD